MATKDWKKISNTRWKGSNNYDVAIIKKPRSKVFAVFLVMGDEKFGYLDWKKLSKDFHSESDALKFAKDYMRSH